MPADGRCHRPLLDVENLDGCKSGLLLYLHDRVIPALPEGRLKIQAYESRSCAEACVDAANLRLLPLRNAFNAALYGARTEWFGAAAG